VEYLRIDGTPLLAELYEPEGEGPFPAVVDVHGGVWTSDSRFQNTSIHEHLAAEGVVVVALDFRMPPAARYPEPVADINYGIRWLKANARTFNTRPELIGGLGTSSGGHQLMLNVIRPDDPRYAALPCAGGYDARLRFAIVGWGVVDPPARYRMAHARGNTRLIDAHDAYWPSEDAMAEGSPQRLLAEAAEALPPLLYLQGTNDDNLTPDMAERFAAAYRRAGGDVQLEIFPGRRHTFVTKEPDAPDSVRARTIIATFIRACLARP
jgi:acetyl esterase